MDTHLSSRSLLNWNSSSAATAAESVKECRNGQVNTKIFRKQNMFPLESGGLSGKVEATNV